MTRYHRPILRHTFPYVRIWWCKRSIFTFTVWFRLVGTHMFLWVERRRGLWFHKLPLLNPGLVGQFRLACVWVRVLWCCSSRPVVSSNRLINPASILIQRLMVIQSEHLSLLLVLVLCLLRSVFVVIEARLLIALSSINAIIRLIVLFVEKCEVVWVLALAVCWVGVYTFFVLSRQMVFDFGGDLEMCGNLLWRFCWLRWSSFLVWRLKLARLLGSDHHWLFVAYALVACVTCKNSIAGVRIVIVCIVSATNIVWIVMNGMARTILLAYPIVVSESCRRWRDAAQARIVSTSTLQNLIRQHLWGQVLSLTDLRAILQTVGLLCEENVSVIVRSFDNFWSGPPIFNIYSKTLIRLWTLRTLKQAIAGACVLCATRLTSSSYLMVEVAVMLFITLRSAIGRPEPTEPWRVHLFLQEVTIVSIMNVRIILQSLHQVSGVIPLSTIWMWLPCIRIQYILLVGSSIAYQSSICVLLDLFSSSLIINGSFPWLPIPLIALTFASSARLKMSCGCVIWELLLLRAQKQLFYVLWVLVRWLLFTVAEFWKINVGILFLIQTSRATIQSYLSWLLSIVPTISITEGRFIASYKIAIELITRRNIGGVVVRLLARMRLAVGVQVIRVRPSAVVRVVDDHGTGVARVWGDSPDAVFKVDYGRPLLINIIIIFIIWNSATEGNVPSFLHGRLRHRAVVYIAVSVEGGLDLPVGGWVRIMVLARHVLRHTTDQFFCLLWLRKFCRKLTNALQIAVRYCCIGSVNPLERAIIIL